LLGALAYVVLPVDLVPDVVPVLGWLDDVGVVAAVMAFFGREVARHAAARSVTVDAEAPRRLALP
jgi:uncharacterized membrane protein YkvA (DUF1232 family)